jgi:hypothetical protein
VFRKIGIALAAAACLRPAAARNIKIDFAREAGLFAAGALAA